MLMRRLKRVVAASFVVFAVSPAAQARPEAAKAVVLPLTFEGQLVPADREVLRQRLMLGLQATGLRVTTDEDIQRALGTRTGPCQQTCRKEVASKLQARYVVGGKVKGQHSNFKISLWLADGYSGDSLAEVPRRCDLCGIMELASTMELAASALHAKLQSLAQKPARVEVVTDPAGAEIYVDDDKVGLAPRTLELAPGDHVITARAPDHRPKGRRVTAVAGVHERVELDLERNVWNLWRKRIGWISLVTGAAAATMGGVLVGLHGDGTDCSQGQAFEQVCNSTHNTAAIGWTSVGVGVAAVGVGVYLLLTGNEPAEQPVALIPEGPGFSIRGRF